MIVVSHNAIFNGTDENGPRRGAPVVVGFDESPGARVAVRHAWEEACLRRVSLHVVTAFEPQQWAFAYGVTLLPPIESEDTVRRRAEDGVHDALADLSGVCAVGPPVEVSVVAGPAAEALLERSRGAALLVVGHRGRGAVTSAVLGSVGLSCVLHAACPITVVRPTDDAHPPADEPGHERNSFAGDPTRRA